MQKQLTAPDIRAAKGERRLAMMTAYDYPAGAIVDRAGADMVLVGDSLAMVVLGHEDTLSVTLEEMLHHTRAVSRAVKRALVIGDLPFGSYQESVAQAVRSATRMVAEGGARAVKLEGANMIERVRAIVEAGIPVQGHVGLTPQFVAAFGGFKIQGKTAAAARRIAEEAQALVEAGCFSVVLEGVPAPVAEHITRSLPVPTIGIGAGPDCDGQVLVLHDVVGLFDRFTPRFVKRYGEAGSEMERAVSEYVREVREGVFPDREHSFAMDPDELKTFLED